MKLKKELKIARGTLDEQRQRETKNSANLRALLFILPLVMVAVFVAGLYFGYISYKNNAPKTSSARSKVYFDDDSDEDPMLLTIVSSAYPLDQSYVPELEEIDGVQVNAAMEKSLNNLFAAAKHAGYEFVLDGGYISFEEQKKIYADAIKSYKKKAKVSTVRAESYVKKTIPKEGESERQTGLLIYLTDDVKGKFEDSDGLKWLLKHCTEYGFVLRYPREENPGGLTYSAHLFRYVGEENAYFMRAYNMTFDEYVNYVNIQ